MVRQTHMTKLIFAFRNFAKATKTTGFWISGSVACVSMKSFWNQVFVIPLLNLKHTVSHETLAKLRLAD